jgi:hypothetical protein
VVLEFITARQNGQIVFEPKTKAAPDSSAAFRRAEC